MKEQEVGDASAFHGVKIPARADSKPIGKGCYSGDRVKYFLDQVASIPFPFAASDVYSSFSFSKFFQRSKLHIL